MKKKRGGRVTTIVNVGCWNMRSMVEDDGGLETDRARKGKRMKGAVEKKSVLLVWELKRYNVYAAGISETKWFSDHVYRVEGFTILTSGRRLPDQGDEVRRGEGVGLVLSPEATQAWVDGGKQWKAVSSRVVTARLSNGEAKHKKHLTLVSVYAPTFRAPESEKDDFFDDLQVVLDGVPSDDVLVVMGDWNARVGSNMGDGLWDGTLGRHGVGARNEAGLALLSFSGLNGLSVMNTFL